MKSTSGIWRRTVSDRIWHKIRMKSNVKKIRLQLMISQIKWKRRMRLLKRTSTCSFKQTITHRVSASPSPITSSSRKITTSQSRWYHTWVRSRSQSGSFSSYLWLLWLLLSCCRISMQRPCCNEGSSWNWWVSSSWRCTWLKIRYLV